MIFNRVRNQSAAATPVAAQISPAGPSREALERELVGMLRPRIGITGSFGRGNYGDELYVRVYEYWFGRWAKLSLLTGINRPSYFRDLRNAQVDAVDAIVLGGGDLLCPYGERVDPDFINPMYLRRPVHIAGIGVQLNRPDIDPRTLEKWRSFIAHENVRSVSARDARSAAWIEEHICPGMEVPSHPDLVCALPLPPASRPEGAPILGLVTRHIKHPREYELMAEVSRRLTARGWRVRHIIGGVGPHGQKDLDNANSLEVDGKETVHSENLDDISRALGECSLVLSMKLHTTLVATMYGVPTVSVNPVAKARAFMASVGREKYAVSSTDARLLDLVEVGVPEVSTERISAVRSEAEGYLRALSQRIWDDYRGRSAVRRELLAHQLVWD